MQRWVELEVALPPSLSCCVTAPVTDSITSLQCAPHAFALGSHCAIIQQLSCNLHCTFYSTVAPLHCTSHAAVLMWRTILPAYNLFHSATMPSEYCTAKVALNCTTHSALLFTLHLLHVHIVVCSEPFYQLTVCTNYCAPNGITLHFTFCCCTAYCNSVHSMLA